MHYQIGLYQVYETLSIKMINKEQILELLVDSSPQVFCDDCISNELNITPRQQVNQLCRALSKNNEIVRRKGICSSCNRRKLINIFSARKTKIEAISFNEVEGPEISPSYSEPLSVLPIIDIEKMRTQIVHICYELWKDHFSDEPSHSISVVINSLKSNRIIPFHQANMMLTICNLRNAYVYENLCLGEEEILIAHNAMKIIDIWIKTNQ